MHEEIKTLLILFVGVIGFVTIALKDLFEEMENEEKEDE
jgi:hypothetical protein